MADISIAVTFDDGPHSGDLGSPGHPTQNRTEKILDALTAKGIKAGFFVQTHAPDRMSSLNGKKIAQKIHDGGHMLVIHTGSLLDHRCHKSRVTKPADVPGTTNGLDSDMSRAKSAIQGIAGAAPKFVRATFGYTNQDCMDVYAARALKHVMWDIDSTDTAEDATESTVSSHLTTATKSKLDSGELKLIYLFHDINPITCDHIGTFIDKIGAAVTAKGHTPKFTTTATQISDVFTSKARKGDDLACPSWSL